MAGDDPETRRHLGRLEGTVGSCITREELFERTRASLEKRRRQAIRDFDPECVAVETGIFGRDQPRLSHLNFREAM